MGLPRVAGGAGADTVRYGGNTSCVEVRLDSGPMLVLDAGTGMRPLGVAIDQDPVDELHIMLTHLHMDHLQGLGFFRPLFRPGVDMHIWGPASPVQSLADRIAMYLSPPLFPVHLDDIPAQVTFHDAPERSGDDRLGDRSRRQGHAPGTDGRLPHRGERADVRVPPRPRAVDRRRPRDEPPAWMSGHDVAHDADVLFHDAQYRDDEYGAHIGWGHSCIEHAWSSRTRPRSHTVVLFHHDPYHTDDELEALLADARGRWDGAHEQVCLAHEGMTITLDHNGVRFAD